MLISRNRIHRIHGVFNRIFPKSLRGIDLYRENIRYPVYSIFSYLSLYISSILYYSLSLYENY